MNWLTYLFVFNFWHKMMTCVFRPPYDIVNNKNKIYLNTFKCLSCMYVVLIKLIYNILPWCQYELILSDKL